MSSKRVTSKKEHHVKSESFSTKSSDMNSNSELYQTNDTKNNQEHSDCEDNNETPNDDDVGDDNKKNTEELKVKILFNNASGNNRCNYCRECFANPLMVLRHKREVHSFPKLFLPLEEIEKYYDYPNRNYCPICKKNIKTNNYRSIFLKHLHTHTLTTVFECIICKKKFRRKDHMLNHQKRHVVPIEDFIKDKEAKS